MAKQYGRWTVIRRSDRVDGRGKRRWIVCRCICGTEKEVESSSLSRGASCSCGCLRSDGIKAKAYVAGKEREHSAWRNAINRCCNSRIPNYNIYGGRGITVCKKWKASFLSFYSDMGPCPEGYTLERVDNDKGYRPSNCVWATKKANCRNKTTTRWVTFRGVRRSLAEWSETTGIPYKTLHKRISLGWNINDALTKPIRGATA